MRRDELLRPRKFTFDEFYEILNQFVNDPEVRESLALYDAEANAGRGQIDDSTGSNLAREALGKFNSLSWSILQKYGYPSYSELIYSTQDNFELRKQYWNLEGHFRAIAQRLLRNTREIPNWLQKEFRDENFDVNDKQSVLRLLIMWRANRNQSDHDMPFIL